jgi:hypothetical protein
MILTTFFDVSDTPQQIMAYMGNLFADFKPLFILIAGILLGLLVISAIISFLKG